MGLAAAYQALQEGHQVDLLEASNEAGGMAAHVDFGGVSIERFITLYAGQIIQLLSCCEIWESPTNCVGGLRPWGSILQGN
jgi:protoporphyrinogen oxidase